MADALDIDWDAVGFEWRSDRAIAAELGCARATVQRQRKKRGIQAFATSPPRPRVPDGLRIRPATSHGLYWLGAFPGAAACQLLGCGGNDARFVVFLLRGQLLTMTLCPEHSTTIQKWAEDPQTDVVTQLVKSLQSPCMMKDADKA